MIRIGLPSRGRLAEETLGLVGDCGYLVSESERQLVWRDQKHDIEFYLLRPADIPVYVESGVLSAGITGLDLLEERGVTLDVLLELGYGEASLCVAVDAGSRIESLEQLGAARVATSFPNITRSRLPEAHIVHLTGSVEVAIDLGIADAIVDLVQTGETLRRTGLRPVGEPLLRSCAAFVVRNGHLPGEVEVMRDRLLGRTLAVQYVMVEYDVPEGALEAATKVTPGWESPTVSPLKEHGWFAVRAMVSAHDAHRILDDLAGLGCTGIVVSRIEHLRSGTLPHA